VVYSPVEGAVVKEKIMRLLMKLRLQHIASAVVRVVDSRRRFAIKFPTYDARIAKAIAASLDPVRYAAVAMALKSIERENIPGSVAEVGVYRGDLSRLIHALAPQRELYLFDTFAGFPEADLDGPNQRFRDTSVEMVKRALGDLNHVIFRKGYFPETAKGLEQEKFAFVMLDLDLYRPTAAGVEFFYPRLVSGGYLFAHDYNSPESDHAVARAVNEYLKDKPEKIIELPDRWGSIVIRKI
jgi:O-methyltransferase